MSDILSQMPEEIRRALYGATYSTTERKPFDPIGDTWNPWTTGSTEGAIPYTDDESEERELYRALEPLEKLFHRGNFTTTTSSPSPRFRFSKSPTPSSKENKELRYEKVVVEGELWCHGFDEAGDLQSAMLVIDDTDD